MDALRLTCVAMALCVATPIAADQLDPWRAIIAEASARFGVPVEWISQVMRAESAGRTTLDGRPITSTAGAMGLMQIMPTTWAAMRAQLGLGTNPYQPRDNILAGTFYLRLMYERFGYPGLFGAYNAGPGRYAEHLATGRTLPGETRAYLAKVAGPAPALAQTATVQPANGIFFALGAKPDTGAVGASSRPTLFVTLRETPPDTPGQAGR